MLSDWAAEELEDDRTPAAAAAAADAVSSRVCGIGAAETATMSSVRR